MRVVLPTAVVLIAILAAEAGFTVTENEGERPQALSDSDLLPAAYKMMLPME